MQITGNIYQVGGEGHTSPEDAAIYLITANGAAALVDAGCGRAMDRLLKNIEACGTDLGDIQLLFLTHCHFDHTGGAAALGRRLECRIVAHTAEARFLETGDNHITAASWYGSKLTPFTVDHKIRDPLESFTVGDLVIEARHMPGHSPGSVMYFMESDGLKVCFGQDVHGPLDRRMLSDPDEYEKSLMRLIEMEPDVLCEGHFGVFFGRDKVRDFVEQYL